MYVLRSFRLQHSAGWSDRKYILHIKDVCSAEKFVRSYKTIRCQNEDVPVAVCTTLLLIKDKHWNYVVYLDLLFVNFVCLFEYGN
jgi:hypothetical protein